MERAHDAKLQAAKLGKSAHTSETGITGVRGIRLLQIVHHAVPVIGAHRNAPILPSGFFPPDLLIAESLHQFIHIDSAFQMIRLEEVAVTLMLRAAHMHEMNAVGTLFEHRHDIVILACAETAGAETDTVRRAVHILEQPADILDIAEDARQSQPH